MSYLKLLFNPVQSTSVIKQSSIILAYVDIPKTFGLHYVLRLQMRLLI